MSKICFLNQPAGLGDIIFCLKIGFFYKAKGYDVIWPVSKVYLETIKEHIIAPINFVDTNSEIALKYKEVKEPYYSDDLVILPLDGCTRFIKNKKIMEAKYEAAKVEKFDDWNDYFYSRRDYFKETNLYHNVLGLEEDEKYCLVSKNYASPPDYLKFPMSINTSLKIVELDFKPSFTLFDWCKVLENASEIYMIDSSINFLIDKLRMKTDNLYLYSRRGSDFSEIDYLFKTKYHFCT